MILKILFILFCLVVYVVLCCLIIKAMFPKDRSGYDEFEDDDKRGFGGC
jgi:hypothetical protein